MSLNTLDKLQPKLLWTNSKPSVAFAAQTVNLDLSNYDKVIIEFAGSKDTASSRCQYTLKVGQNNLCYGMANLAAGGSASYTCTRFVNVTTSSVVFPACTYKAFNASTATTNNDYFIPLRIYGIGGGLTS